MKLSLEDKKEIIRLKKEEKISIVKLSKMFNVSRCTINDLLSLYKHHGETIFMKHPKRCFTPEEKMKIINRYYNGESKRSLAIENNIKTTMISSWLTRYERDGFEGLFDKNRRS